LTEADFAALKLPPETAALLRWLCSEEAELDKLKALMLQFGDEWIQLCPANAQLAARRWLANWCEAGEWAQALEWLHRLARSGEPWAVELAALGGVRRALERATRGELEEAERELRALEEAL